MNESQESRRKISDFFFYIARFPISCASADVRSVLPHFKCLIPSKKNSAQGFAILIGDKFEKENLFFVQGCLRLTFDIA